MLAPAPGWTAGGRAGSPQGRGGGLHTVGASAAGPGSWFCLFAHSCLPSMATVRDKCHLASRACVVCQSILPPAAGMFLTRHSSERFPSRFKALPLVPLAPGCHHDIFLHTCGLPHQCLHDSGCTTTLIPPCSFWGCTNSIHSLLLGVTPGGPQGGMWQGLSPGLLHVKHNSPWSYLPGPADTFFVGRAFGPISKGIGEEGRVLGLPPLIAGGLLLVVLQGPCGFRNQTWVPHMQSMRSSPLSPLSDPTLAFALLRPLSLDPLTGMSCVLS